MLGLSNDSRYYKETPIHSDYYEDTIVVFGAFYLLKRRMDFLLRMTVNCIDGKQKIGNTCFALLDEARNEYSENYREYAGDRIITDNKKLFARTSEVEIGVHHDGMYVYAEMEPISVKLNFRRGDLLSPVCGNGKFELDDLALESYSYPDSSFKGSIFIANNNFEINGQAWFTRLYQKRNPENAAAGRTALLRFFLKDRKTDGEVCKGYLQARLKNGNHVDLWFGRVGDKKEVWAQAINPYGNRTELDVTTTMEDIMTFLENKKKNPKTRLKMNFLEKGNENYFVLDFMPQNRSIVVGDSEEDKVEYYEGLARVTDGEEVIGLCYVNFGGNPTEK